MFGLFVGDREKGASLVEFAVVLPLLILLVFGIMEAGWLFAQQVEVRNAAEENAVVWRSSTLPERIRCTSCTNSVDCAGTAESPI